MMRRNIGILVMVLTIMAGCTSRKQEAVEFNPRRLLSFHDLIKADLYKSMDQALQNPDTVIKLILFNKNLENVPNKIVRLQYLNTLELSRNQIGEIPTNLLSQLPYLQSLYMPHNDLTKVPGGIADLEQLKRLSLADNHIHTISPLLGNVDSLESLNLDRNQIKVVPAEIAKLKKLEVFKVNGNRIESIPFSLSELPALQKVELSHNPLKEIPHGVLKLKNLKHLELVNTRVPRQKLDSLKKQLPKNVYLKY